MFPFINSNQWFLVCGWLLAPKSEMYHILEAVWAHFQRTKMTLSHTFCANKMGKLKMTLKYCQIIPPPNSLKKAFPNTALWIHYGQLQWLLFAPLGEKMKEAQGFLQFLKTDERISWSLSFTVGVCPWLEVELAGMTSFLPFREQHSIYFHTGQESAYPVLNVCTVIWRSYPGCFIFIPKECEMVPLMFSI